MPTVHGFDEFFGNLYHLNAEEEPENLDYPKDPAFKEKFGPRGVFHCYATDDRERTPRRRPLREVGQAALRGHRPADEEADGDDRRGGARPHRSSSSTRKQQAGQALVRLVQHDPHAHLHPPASRSRRARRGWDIYADGMVEHDGHIGQMLKKLDDLGVADNTIVIYTTDNGAEVMSWPDGGTTPFRGEKNTQLGGRLPRAAGRALARRDQARHRDQRDHLARGLAADAAGGRWPAQRQGVAADRARRRRARPTRCTSTVTT